MAKSAKRTRMKPVDERIFTLEVFIIEGMITEKFAERNPVLGRTIQIRGDQTLEDLHTTIFHAFDRFDNHFYEFQFGGKGINDPKARIYVLPQMNQCPLFQEKPTHEGIVNATIGDVGIEKGDIFGYRFDYGDEWLHQINVETIDERGDGGVFPRVIDKIGVSPPQYPDYDDEDGDQDNGEDVHVLDEMRAEVPGACLKIFDLIVSLTDAFCEDLLNAEYKRLARVMVFDLCQYERMILKGKPESWAAGVLYALGRVNFLDDLDYPPYLKVSRIAEYFGISVATMRAKGKAVADKLGLFHFHPDWTLPSLMDINPMAWMIQVDGIVIDARKAPRHIQKQAFEEGLIPRIPADRDKARPDQDGLNIRGGKK